MDGFLKKVNLGWRLTPDTRQPDAACPDSVILKDGFFKNSSKYHGALSGAMSSCTLWDTHIN